MKLTQTGLVLCYMSSRIQKKDKNKPCLYDSIHQSAFPHVSHCSNQCEYIYSELGCEKRVDIRINLVESRILVSNEKDLKCYRCGRKTTHRMLQKYFLMEILLNINPSDLKKDSTYWCVLVVHPREISGLMISVLS